MTDSERSPGWYPDPRDPQSSRYWDGTRWTELAASTRPRVASPDADGSEVATPPPGPGSGATPRWAVFAVTAIAILGGAAALVVLLTMVFGGDDSETRSTDGDSPAATTVPTGPGQTIDPGSSTSVDGSMPDASGSPSTQPGGSTGSGGSPGTASPCTVDGALLLDRLKAYPPLSSFAAELTLTEVRCSSGWATGVASTPSTDTSLAVFREDGDDWEVVLVGSAEPCSGLDIPSEAQSQLGCDFRSGG